MLRSRDRTVDYLVLADSPLVLDRNGTIEVINDLRLKATSERQRRAVAASTAALGSSAHQAQVLALIEAQRPYRNQLGGYWLASSAPEAGHHAVSGAIPLDGPDRLTRAALLTDGASRAVDAFGLLDWTGLLDVLQQHGPGDLIARVRAAEYQDMEGSSRQRLKVHDDATAAFCLF
jgi:hypothetical protein